MINNGNGIEIVFYMAVSYVLQLTILVFVPVSFLFMI